MRTYIAIATLALLAGCGGSGDDAGAGEPEPVPQSAEAATEPQDEASEPMPPDGQEWAPEYETPEDVIAALQAGGVECEPGEVMSPTAASKASQDCYVNADETDFYDIDVYASPAQQGEAQVYFSDVNPGSTYVWGTGWSVKVPTNSDGSEVVGILGGTVH
jgi:hypothetical protein